MKKLNQHQQWILDEARRVLDGEESWAMFHGKELGRLHLKYGSGISFTTLKAMEKKGAIRLVGYSGHDFELVEAEPAAATAQAESAGTWTPAVGELVRIVRDGDNNGVTGFVTKIDSTMPVEVYRVYGHWYYRSELELVKVAAPAVNADGATAEAPPPGMTWRDVADDAHGDWLELKRTTDAEIARLRRERDAALSERDALRAAFERDEKQLAITQQVKDERLSELMDETDKLVAALESISPMEGLTRLLSFRRFYNEFVQELHRAEASPDAAMIAALRDRDTGQRTAAGDVLGDVLA